MPLPFRARFSGARAACLLGILSACGAPALTAHDREVLVPTYVFGAFGARSVDARDLCAGAPVERVELQRRFADYLAAALTLGLYVPHRVHVACGGRR